VAGAEESAVAVLLDFEDFFDVEALPVPEAGAAAEASVLSVFLLFFDLLALEGSVEAAPELLAAASVFLDFDVFLVGELSAAVLLSAVSDFFDFDDFLGDEVSAAEASALPVFLLFADFLLLEASVEVASCESAFFFLDLDALASLWSVEVCAACPATACRTTVLQLTSSKADSNAKYPLLEVKFIYLDEFLSRYRLTSPAWHTENARFGRGNRGKNRPTRGGCSWVE